MKEIRIFFTALMFLTRLPVPRYVDHSPAYLEKATKYFPLVGCIVGSISALVFLLCQLVLSIELSMLASFIASILVTGAFHEDGFADACDGFGGGWTKEKILLIMKDSRLGTFGVLGLIFIFAVKFMLLHELFLLQISIQTTFGIVVLGHTVSRLMAVVTIQISRYVSSEESKSMGIGSAKLSTGSLFIAISIALLPFILLPGIFLLLLIPTLIITMLLSSYFKKWIGGYTGDCLGAIQQTIEVVCYLSIIMIWKYI
jgi:adenosylcobinamide-GDP ribazoletransferase